MPLSNHLVDVCYTTGHRASNHIKLTNIKLLIISELYYLIHNYWAFTPKKKPISSEKVDFLMSRGARV